MIELPYWPLWAWWGLGIGGILILLLLYIVVAKRFSPTGLLIGFFGFFLFFFSCLDLTHNIRFIG
jgi:hypothetical protein